MPELKIAIQLASLRQPLQQGLLTAARLGAAAVEIDARGEVRAADLSRTGVRHVRKLLDDYGLRVCAVGFQTRRGYDVADDLQRRVEATRQAMQLAAWLGAAVVVNQVGRVPDAAEGPAWNSLVEVLTDLGRHGQRVGALLAARTGTESGADLARLLDALPEGSIGVDLDPAGLITGGHSPREAVQSLGGAILHVHARDATRDLALGRGTEVPLGRGTADFPELLGLLEQHNYRGWLTIERTGGPDPVAEIGLAVEYLKNL